jgi:hypothetical protein
MQKLDRLGWAAGICFRAYGWRIGIRVDEPETLERMAPCLPPGWEPSPAPFVDQLYSLRVGSKGGRREHLLHAGCRLSVRTTDLEQACQVLEGDIRLFLAEKARDRIFVHAGVVGWQGRALLVPGRSYSGKSTLVAALLRAGATYCSDEYAVLDSRGLVHPYARELKLRVGPELQCHPPERFGARSATAPLPVGLVALARYQPGARWQPRRLSHGRALLEVLNHTVPARSRPEAALATLQAMLPSAVTVKGLRGEAEETAVALLKYLKTGCTDRTLAPMPRATDRRAA